MKWSEIKKTAESNKIFATSSANHSYKTTTFINFKTILVEKFVIFEIKMIFGIIIGQLNK